MTGKELKEIAAQIQDEAIIQHTFTEGQADQYWNDLTAAKIRGVVIPKLSTPVDEKPQP